MHPIISFSDLKCTPNLTCRGPCFVKWNGIKVEVIKFSFRERKLIQQIIDLFIMLLIGLVTFWAAFEFPCCKLIEKNALYGRKKIIFVDLKSIPQEIPKKLGQFINFLKIEIALQKWPRIQVQPTQ